METYKALSGVMGDGDAFRERLAALDADALTELVRYLMKMKMTRDKCTSQSRRLFKETHGCSYSWHRIKENPDEHAKVIERKRLERKKRKEAIADGDASA